jgi:transposase
MEACGGAHHWGRQLQKAGHTVKLMAPQFVKPYVKTNKNDMADAEAICEAVRRPTMRFVPMKNGEQQAVLSLHRARQGFVRARTAQANQIRGLLAEYGMIIPQGISQIGRRLPAILEDGENDLPGLFRGSLQRLGEHLKKLDLKPPLAMPRASRTAGSWLLGWVLSPGSTPAAAKRSCLALVNAATGIYARCWSTAPDQCCA